MCYTLEKQISENKEKLEGVEIGPIEGLIKEGREAVEKQDDEKVTSVLEALEKAAHEMATKMYGAGGEQAAGAEAAEAAEASADDGAEDKKADVIDAEFEETS